MAEDRSDWHHAPIHIFVPGTVYMVTAGTLHKEHFFHGDQRLAMLRDLLLDCLHRYGWGPHAWAVFANHYHFIAKSPEAAANLSNALRWLHSASAREVNRLDATPGRQVWHQYWDKCLTFEKSYYARLNYVINNAVHHALAPIASRYPYCSAGEFEAQSPSAFQRKVASFRYDEIHEPDEF